MDTVAADFDINERENTTLDLMLYKLAIFDGVIRDVYDNLLDSVLVELINNNGTELLDSYTTEPDGTFEFMITAGIFDLLFSKVSFYSHQIDDFTLDWGVVENPNLVLHQSGFIFGQVTEDSDPPAVLEGVYVWIEEDVSITLLEKILDPQKNTNIPEKITSHKLPVELFAVTESECYTDSSSNYIIETNARTYAIVFYLAGYDSASISG